MCLDSICPQLFRDTSTAPFLQLLGHVVCPPCPFNPSLMSKVSNLYHRFLAFLIMVLEWLPSCRSRLKINQCVFSYFHYIHATIAIVGMSGKKSYYSSSYEFIVG